MRKRHASQYANFGSLQNYAFKVWFYTLISCRKVNGYAPEYVNKDVLFEFWDELTISKALSEGIIHYNGQKPWKGLCVNFDIWWEYYRKSPFFDEKFYFDFFYHKLNELDGLSLLKRIKILVRYFVFGRKNIDCC